MSQQYGQFNWQGISGLRPPTKRLSRTSSGVTYQYVYGGTEAACWAGYSAVPLYQNAEVIEDDGSYSLVVTSPDDPTGQAQQVVTEKFELVGNDIERDILEHPLALALDTRTIQQIRHLISTDRFGDDAEEDEDWVNFKDDLGFYEPGGDDTFALILLDALLKRHGQMSFSESQYVFKATKTISKQNELVAAFANQDKLYTFGQVKYETNAPATYVASLDQIAAQCQPSSIRTGEAWRWLKRAIQIEDAPGNRAQIQLEYTLAVWETWVYEASTSPTV